MCDDKVHTALLKGWDGPVFPESLEGLRVAQVENQVLTWAELREAGNLASGFFHSDKPMTSDRYFWYLALYFFQGENKAAVLFPWHQDHNAENKSDRSIAVYTKGEVDLERLISQLISAMKQVGQKRVQTT